MKTSKRLENAIQKLYNAFHNDLLHPEYCDKCAVGNIFENRDTWQHFTDSHGSLKLNYVGLVNQNFGKKFYGYTPLELLQIEVSFLKGCGYQLPFRPGSKRPNNPTDKDLQFNGLCEVINYLCELDGVSNVMDYTQLFEVKTTSIKEEANILTA